MTGLYLHIPFCATRCTYCSFFSTTQGDTTRHAFVQTLLGELHLRRTTDTVGSIYFGGGTPSQLDDEEICFLIEAIARNYHIAEDAELTLEANPDDLTPERAARWARFGINRVSIGVQSFDDRILRTIHRRHNARQAIAAIKMLRTAGISNLSLDLIYGLPRQTLTDWEADVHRALDLDVDHLSAYALSFEPGTMLHRQLLRGEVTECDEELSLTMFQSLIRLTTAAGMEHYEISNFARPGRRARHNSAYWTGAPYLGFGPGAHSFDGRRTRRHNLPLLPDYNATPTHNGHDVPHELEHLNEEEHYNEVVMTRLRTSEGINLTRLAADCGVMRHDFLLTAARHHLYNGRLALIDEEDARYLRFTPKGIFISDDVMSDLMWG